MIENKVFASGQAIRTVLSPTVHGSETSRTQNQSLCGFAASSGVLNPQENKTHVVKYFDVNLFLFGSAIGLLNSFFYKSFTAMMLLSAIEILLCIFFLLRRDHANFLGIYMFAVCFSLESSNYVGDEVFYSLKNTRFLGLNLAVWILLPLVILVIKNYELLLNNQDKINKSLIRKIALYTFLVILMGLITYVLDDNGISSQSGSFTILVNTAYSYILPFFEICIVSLLVYLKIDRLETIKKYLYAIIVADTVVFLACMIFRNYGNRGGLESLQVSEVSFIVACALVTIVYKDFQLFDKILLTICSVIILLLSLIYNSSGKLLFVVVLAPIAMIIIAKRKGMTVMTLLGGFFAVLAFVFIVTWLLPQLIQGNQLLGIKFDQFTSFITLGPDWLNNMAESPKMRIAEFMNIIDEYMRKPWYLLFGKGCCGTIRDNLGLFSELTTFAFSEWELELGAFYTVHESLNIFFLSGGLYGLYVLLSICGQIYRNLEKSPWLVIGGIWLLLFYTYHMSLSFYGIVALVVGMADLNKKREMEA